MVTTHPLDHTLLFFVCKPTTETPPPPPTFLPVLYPFCLSSRLVQDSSAAVVVAAYKAGDHAAAVAWVDRLRSAGLAISRNGYAAAVHACCALGEPEAAAGVLGVMSEAQVAASASLYNAVLETICPPSEGGYSATVRLRDEAATSEAGETVEAVDGSGGGGVCESCGGVAEINGLAGAGGGRGTGQEQAREGAPGKEPPEPGPGRGSKAAEKAESAVALFEEMRERKVPMNGVTYAMVICALLEAEREDEVLRLWTQVRDKLGRLRWVFVRLWVDISPGGIGRGWERVVGKRGPCFFRLGSLPA